MTGQKDVTSEGDKVLKTAKMTPHEVKTELMSGKEQLNVPEGKLETKSVNEKGEYSLKYRKVKAVVAQSKEKSSKGKSVNKEDADWYVGSIN